MNEKRKNNSGKNKQKKTSKEIQDTVERLVAKNLKKKIDENASFKKRIKEES